MLLVSPLYLEATSTSPATAGLLITVLPFVLGVVAPVAGIAADRFGAATVTTLGMAVVTIGLIVAALVAPNRGVLVVVLAVAGIGLGLFTPANNATVARAGRAEQAGMVSGLLNMTRGVGTSVGVALAGATFALTAGRGHGRAINADSAVAGWHATMLVLSIVAATGALVCARQPRRRTTHQDDRA